MQRSFYHLLSTTALSALLASAVLASQPPAAMIPSGGTFIDKAGAKHAWSISESHTLVWDGQSYLPVGGCFYPASLSSEMSEKWDKDIATLNDLKSKGVRDIIVVPDVSLPDTSPVRMQKLLDYLDSNDFRYGIAFGKGIPNPLTGTVVKPASYKAYSEQSLSASWQTPNVDGGLVVLAATSTGHNEVVKVTSTKAEDGNITVSVETPAIVGKVVPYLFPHKSVPSGTSGAIPDIWFGYDSYRDRLLAYFAQVKPGKGFRFFLDPLGAQLSLADETDYLVPDSPAFLLEWESYIRTTYPNIEDAYQSWGFEEASALTAKELAHLLPLWSNNVSIPYMYNPATHKTMRLADAIQSHWWLDFLNCRNNSLKYYMNGLADVLKRHVADVPIVYSWTMNHPIFINKHADSGFDGLSITANVRGTRLINRVASPAYSEVIQSARRIWCIESSSRPELDPDPSVSENSSPGIPFASQSMLTQEVTDLRRAGVKGFFPGSFRNDAANTGRNDWLRTPNAVDWLREAGSSVVADARSADYVPNVLRYPIGAPGPALIGQIGNTGVSWLPTYESGVTRDWWPACSGYTFMTQTGLYGDTVLVDLSGNKEPKHFFINDPKLVTAKTVTGVTVPIKVVNKTQFSLVFPDKSPVVFTTGGQELLMPIEAASEALEQLRGLYKYASSMKSQELEPSKTLVVEAEQEFQKHNFGLASSAARNGIGRLLDETAPYIWIEGETFSSTTFDDTPAFSGASHDGYLRVSNYNNPPREYAVHYPFNIVTRGKYNIWIAATTPAADVSPFQWALIDNQRRDPADPNPHGLLYANEKFGWILLGTADFKEVGPNMLAIYVTGRAPATGRYSFGIDAIFMTTRSDPPYGRNMPLPVLLDSKSPLRINTNK